MLLISIEKQRKRPLFEILLGGRMGGEPAGGGARLVKRKYIIGLLFFLFQMISINIEKQRKRPPFFKFCLAYGWAGAGGRRGPDLANENIL